MFSTKMRTALLQATALCTISMMLEHHTSALVFDAVWDDESFTNMVDAVNMSAVSYNNINRGQLALDSGEISSITTTRDHTNEFQNATPRDPFAFPKEAFYSHCLPREIFIFLIITALQYWWHIFLERILPGRPKPQAAQPEKEAEYTEGREEEVVQKWITQGLVQRSSLNWCNTLLKWVVEMTVGRLWYHIIEHGIRLLLKPEDPTTSTIGLKHHLALNYISTWLSPLPLATLIAFIIVPEHKRVVFMAGANLVSWIFRNTLVRIFATWAVKTEFMQTAMQNITTRVESARYLRDFESNYQIPESHGDEL